MMLRRTETALAWVSTGVLASYAPVETIYSWSGGLGSPYYIIDIIAFALILAGELLADVLGHGGCEAHQTPDVTVALARRAGRWTILEFLDPNRHGEGVIPVAPAPASLRALDLAKVREQVDHRRVVAQSIR